jgi:hypothetical protein
MVFFGAINDAISITKEKDTKYVTKSQYNQWRLLLGHAQLINDLKAGNSPG